MFGAHEAMITSAKATLIMGRLMDYNNVQYYVFYQHAFFSPTKVPYVTLWCLYTSNKKDEIWLVVFTIN